MKNEIRTTPEGDEIEVTDPYDTLKDAWDAEPKCNRQLEPTPAWCERACGVFEDYYRKNNLTDAAKIKYRAECLLHEYDSFRGKKANQKPAEHWSPPMWSRTIPTAEGGEATISVQQLKVRTEENKKPQFTVADKKFRYDPETQTVQELHESAVDRWCMRCGAPTIGAYHQCSDGVLSAISVSKPVKTQLDATREMIRDEIAATTIEFSLLNKGWTTIKDQRLRPKGEK